MTVEQLKSAFDTLTALKEYYADRSYEWAALCESLRVLEVAARNLGADTSTWNPTT